MQTKTQQAIEWYKSGDLRKALAIIKTFRIGFTKEQKRSVQIAYECITGNGRFYEQLGYDTATLIREGVNAVEEIFFKKMM